MELLFAFLTPVEWNALRLSLQVALVAALFSLPLAIAAGYVLARFHFFGKWIVEILIDLPLVLPPVVTGYVLLVAFAPHGAVGSFLSTWLGIGIVFTWLGAALASAVVGFPLMVRAIRLAFMGVDPRFEMAARSLGASRLGAFFSVALPLARPGLIAGFMLAFARSLGEFGATIMVAGNIEGKTRTIPLGHLYAGQYAGRQWKRRGVWSASRSCWPVRPWQRASGSSGGDPAMSVLSFRCNHAYPAGFHLDVGFDVDHPFTALFGPSGSGKTSILNMIAGFLRPQQGTIRLGDRVLLDTAGGLSLPPERRHVGVVFQDSLLFPHLTVAGNLRYGQRRRAKARAHARLRSRG